MMSEPGHHPFTTTDACPTGLCVGERGKVLSGVEEPLAEIAPPMSALSAMAEEWPD